ncbi:MAG: copper amine oxidase N-terminal domain-containing protein [Firmicutes bacterium]|nr:copper amine oxidase N-terminal domain-containing protein [Bacillota bacterium]
MPSRGRVLLAACLLTAALAVPGAGAAGAAAPVIVVNGRQLSCDVAPRIVADRVVAPVRAVAEALGAEVAWDQATATVFVREGETALLRHQVALFREALEKAAAPGSAREAVVLWAEGVKARNGALQFAVMAPQLREVRRPEFEACGWVTGVSSPWVEDFAIVGDREVDGGRELEVRFDLATSTGSAGTCVSRVTVRPVGQGGPWYITDIAGPCI